MQSAGRAQANELGYCAWFGFWVPLVVLGLLVILGAAFASACVAPGDYVCGMVLSLSAIGLAFLRLKQQFDGGNAGWGGFLLVDDIPNLVLAIVVFGILALLGLIAAARVDHGGLHDGGVALFVVAALGTFLSIKRVFDNLDRQR